MNPRRICTGLLGLAVAMFVAVTCVSAKVEDEQVADEYRTWTDISDKFTVEATILSVLGLYSGVA